MPGEDGTDVSEHLLNEESTKDIPVVFLTALAQKNEVEKNLGTIGGRLFIAKPITPAGLISRIESILSMC